MRRPDLAARAVLVATCRAEPWNDLGSLIGKVTHAVLPDEADRR
ncbi:hypothetical protein [Streptomyces sp. NPDC017673]